jgi:hypothetical protein
MAPEDCDCLVKAGPLEDRKGSPWSSLNMGGSPPTYWGGAAIVILGHLFVVLVLDV